MKRYAIGLLAVVLTLSALVGCSGSMDNSLRKKIVGTWTSTEPNIVFTNDQTTYFPNGKYLFIANKFFSFEKIVGSGTWDVKDGYLNTRVETSNITNLPNGLSTSEWMLPRLSWSKLLVWQKYWGCSTCILSRRRRQPLLMPTATWCIR